MNVRELCRLLSATLHIPGVERFAARLVRCGLLPRAGCEVYALDAALLLMAVVASPRPADAPRVVVTLVKEIMLDIEVQRKQRRKAAR